ncbi:MAG: DoxX family protein [Methylophilus sp.]|uniref:DoxX family protein n=1 Tax=Methylophilus sp. TaxID=29541 RepID=UPI003FA0B7E0
MKTDKAAEDKHGLARAIVLAVVFIWFFIGGIAHFVFTELEMKIVPPWLPEHRLLVLVSGVFELIGALGILFTPTRRIAGWGLIVLTIAVTPANIYMWQNPGQFPEVPYWVLSLRLPLQLVLLVCIWWSTRVPENRVGT